MRDIPSSHPRPSPGLNPLKYLSLPPLPSQGPLPLLARANPPVNVAGQLKGAAARPGALPTGSRPSQPPANQGPLMHAGLHGPAAGGKQNPVGAENSISKQLAGPRCPKRRLRPWLPQQATSKLDRVRQVSRLSLNCLLTQHSRPSRVNDLRSQANLPRVHPQALPRIPWVKVPIVKARNSRPPLCPPLPPPAFAAG